MSGHRWCGLSTSWLIWVVDKLHEISVAERAALKGCPVLHEKPEKAGLHLLVTFTHNVYLWTNHKLVAVVPQSVEDSTKTRRQGVAAGKYLNLRLIDRKSVRWVQRGARAYNWQSFGT
jgi:hypothetical protein